MNEPQKPKPLVNTSQSSLSRKENNASMHIPLGG